MVEALPLDDEELDDELDELEEFVPEDELEELELELDDELEPVSGEELSPPQAVNPSASSITPPKRNDCFFKLIIMMVPCMVCCDWCRHWGFIMKSAPHAQLLIVVFYRYSSSHLSTLTPAHKAMYAGIHPIYVIWIKFSLGG